MKKIFYRITPAYLIKKFEDFFLLSTNPSKIRILLERTPVFSMLLFALVLLMICVALSWNYYFLYTKDFIIQLLAESHGIILDVLVFGALFFWINNTFDRKRVVAQAYEEIEDLSQCLRIDNDEGPKEVYNHLNNHPHEDDISLKKKLKASYKSEVKHTDYAVLRILRNIRTLNRHGIHELHLSHIEIPKAGLANVILKGSNMMCFRSIMANFTNADLSRCKLNTANLTFSHMEGALLRNVNAQNATFHFANLMKADLSDSVFINTDFSYAMLSHVNFSNSDLYGADFTNAEILNSDFRGCKNIKVTQLQKAKFLHNCKFDTDTRKQLQFFTAIKSNNIVSSAKVDPQKKQPPTQRIAV